MGVAGSLVAGVLKVLLLDVRRPKLGKLKGLFFFLRWLVVWQCYPVLGVVSMAAAACSVTGLAGSARHKVTGRLCLSCVHSDD